MSMLKDRRTCYGSIQPASVRILNYIFLENESIGTDKLHLSGSGCQRGCIFLWSDVDLIVIQQGKNVVQLEWLIPVAFEPLDAYGPA